MKTKHLTILFVLAVLFTIPQNLFSQTVIDVPDTYNGNPIGAINNFIMGDTTSSGERKHPDAIYRLQRGKVYFQDQTMFINFNFSLVADDDDPKNPTRPPMIVRAKNAEGAYVRPFMKVRTDSITIKFKNILFQGIPADEKIVSESVELINMAGSNIKLISDNCIYNYFTYQVFNARSTDHSTYIFKNNIFRNDARLNKEYSGYSLVLSQKVDQDTISIVNNTFFNISAYVLYLKDYTKYVELVHNTIFTTAVGALRLPHLLDAKITDNIIYNYQTYGQDSSQFAKKHYSIVKIVDIDAAKLSDLGIKQSDRKAVYKNNVYGWNQKVKKYWQEYNLVPVPWMDDNTDSLFKFYEGFVDENNIELDPEFDAAMESAVIDKQIKWNEDRRQFGSDYTGFQDRLYYPDGKLFDLTWPLPENLAYTNQVALKHAQGGFPVGDLNWFPEEKAKWEVWTGVEKTSNGSAVPTDYTLSQNYPNPFNPTTVIEFSIPYSGQTTLEVYNVLGQKVKTLVSKELKAGSYSYQFDANNLASGIYFYKLQSNDYSQVKKMMLLK